MQAGPRIHPSSHAVNTGVSFPGGKAAGGDAEHSPPASSELHTPSCSSALFI
jgi:hypothetical protein